MDIKKLYKLGKWSLIGFVIYINVHSFLILYLDNWFVRKPETILLFLIVLTMTSMLPFVFWNYERTIDSINEIMKNLEDR